MSLSTGAGLDHSGPADSSRNAEPTFPVGVLLAAEGRRAAVGPGEHFRAVVGGIHDDGILIEAEFLEFVEHLADVAVVLHHAVGIDAEAGLAFTLRLETRPDVHAGGVPPHEERLVPLRCVRHEAKGVRGDFLVDRLHALFGQRPVLSIFWVPSGFAQQWSTPRVPNFFIELRVLEVVGMLGFVLGVEVVERAERTRRSRARWAGARRDRPGGSCRTARSCSLAA